MLWRRVRSPLSVRRQVTADELSALYQQIGACIWQLQYLEDALHTFLTMKVELKQPGVVSESEARAILAKRRRATLGSSIRFAEANDALPATLIERLLQLKDNRDWLVHRSMHEHGDALYTDDGRSFVSQRLGNILGETLAIKAEVVDRLMAFCGSHGLSSAQAIADAERQVAGKMGL